MERENASLKRVMADLMLKKALWPGFLTQGSTINLNGVGVSMEWTININEKGQYAEVITNGIADKAGSLAMVKAISTALSKTTIKKVLIDHTHISAVSGRVADVFYRPDELTKIGVTRHIMIAEVIRPEYRDFFDFLETVCVNRGFTFSVFNEKSPAIKWLLGAQILLNDSNQEAEK